MSFLNERINLRIRKDIYKQIEALSSKNPKYDSVSHFIRVSINEKLKSEDPSFFEDLHKKIREDLIKKRKVE